MNNSLLKSLILIGATFSIQCQAAHQAYSGDSVEDYRKISSDLHAKLKDKNYITQYLFGAVNHMNEYNIEDEIKQLGVFESSKGPGRRDLLAAFLITKYAFDDYDKEFKVVNPGLSPYDEEYLKRNSVFNAIFFTIANCFYRLEMFAQAQITEEYTQALDHMFNDYINPAIKETRSSHCHYLFDYISFVSKIYARDFYRMTSSSVNSLNECCKDLKISFTSPLGSEHWWTLYLQIISTHISNFSNDQTRKHYGYLDQALSLMFNKLLNDINQQKQMFDSGDVTLKAVTLLPICKAAFKQGFDTLLKCIN